jgi:hypothetical protein
MQGRATTRVATSFSPKVRISTPATVRRCEGPRQCLLCRDCGSRRRAYCRPDPRQPASASGSRSHGRAATLVRRRPRSRSRRFRAVCFRRRGARIGTSGDRPKRERHSVCSNSRAKQRASTTAVDGLLPPRLEKEKRRGCRRGLLLQIVHSTSARVDKSRACSARQSRHRARPPIRALGV